MEGKAPLPPRKPLSKWVVGATAVAIVLGSIGIGAIIILTRPSPPTQEAPGQVENLLAIAGDGYVALSWTPVLGVDAIGNDGYYVYMGGVPPDIKVATTAWNETAYNATGLANGNYYFFAVAAFNEIGEGPKSEVAGAAPASEKSWFYVTWFEGTSGDNTTDVFRIVGDRFRLSWGVTSWNQYGLFTLEVFKVGSSSPVESLFLDFGDVGYGDKTGTTTVLDTGEFYLKTSATDIMSWHIDVEEYRY